MKSNRKSLRALDLYCGAGGAALGLIEAGFEVTGIDIKAHKCYPGTFIQADIRELPIDINDFDLIWASPPCQGFATCNQGNMKGMSEEEIAERYPNLIPLTRNLLAGHPFTIIENVPNAPIRPDVILNGPTLGLKRINRVRWFETSFWVLTPPLIFPSKEDWNSGQIVTVTTTTGNSSTNYFRRIAIGLPGTPPVKEKQEALGIPTEIKMTHIEVGNCVPPTYSAFIARQAKQQIERVKNVKTQRA